MSQQSQRNFGLQFGDILFSADEGSMFTERQIKQEMIDNSSEYARLTYDEFPSLPNSSRNHPTQRSSSCQFQQVQPQNHSQTVNRHSESSSHFNQLKTQFNRNNTPSDGARHDSFNNETADASDNGQLRNSLNHDFVNHRAPIDNSNEQNANSYQRAPLDNSNKETVDFYRAPLVNLSNKETAGPSYRTPTLF